MAAITNWYNNQYANWNRTRRMQAAPFVARTDTRASSTAAAMSQTQGAPGQDVVINMADLLPDGQNSNTTGGNNGKIVKDTLFGPSIGVVDSGPRWTESVAKGLKADELTPDIVREWAARSKEPTPTTVLHALVNLKRPTIRLSPLHNDPSDSTEQHDSHHQQHGLEFEFDCTTPKCRIAVNVVDAPTTEGASTSTATQVTVFETVVEGGHGQKLTLAEGAILELSRFERAHKEGKAVMPEATHVEEPAPTAPTNGATTDANAHHAGSHGHKKRLTFFKKSRHSESVDRTVSGPALAVVDAETTPAPNAASTENTPSPSSTTTKDANKKEEKDQEGGVKITLRLTALDADGKELATRNEQITYLHVVRVGLEPVAPVTQEGEETEKDGEVEDIRPWVVKVVKREALIGPHAFHLHEIYGLSQSSVASHPTAPTAPNPTDGHSYPPSAPLTTINTHEEEPTSECLLCLSAPREVVLLPCRHLVACRDCAINMIEFGAGGQVVHNEEPTAATAPAASAGAAEGVDGDGAASPVDGPAATAEGANAGENANAASGEGAAAPPVVAPPPPATTRRKRKAKGWFCPVCRQPYTALLRITTAPPPSKDEGKDGKRISTASTLDDHGAVPVTMPLTPPAAAITTEPGRTVGVNRPGFLGRFSRNNSMRAIPTMGPDLERGGAPAVAA